MEQLRSSEIRFAVRQVLSHVLGRVKGVLCLDHFRGIYRQTSVISISLFKFYLFFGGWGGGISNYTKKSEILLVAT